MNRMDVVVVGGAGTELVGRGARLPDPGATVVGDTFLRAPGGRGACLSIASARLGASAALVAKIGMDERGEEVLSRCCAEGVEASAIAVDPRAASGATITMMDAGGGALTMMLPGANARLTADDVRGATELIAGTLVLLVDLDVPAEAAREAMEIAVAAGARVFADAGSLDLAPSELLSEMDVLRCGRREAEVLTGIEVTDRRTASKAAQNLVLRGAKAAVVEAPGGHLAYSREGACWIPDLPSGAEGGRATDVAFSAALAVATAWGEDLFDAAWFASGACALSGRRLGTVLGLPRQEEVVSFLHRQRHAMMGRPIERRLPPEPARGSRPRERGDERAPEVIRPRDPPRSIEVTSADADVPSRVDEASLESFPASDPPAFTPGHA